MVQEHQHAVVVGGSIAGLMTALVLRRQSYSVTVLERYHEAEFHDRGQGLGLRTEVTDFLATVKKGDIPHDIPMPFFAFVELDGTIGLKVPSNGTTSTSWTVLMRALRTAFDEPELPGQGTCKFGCKVTNVKTTEGRLEIEYTNSDRKDLLQADLLIAADGAASTVRALYAPRLTRPYAGYYLARGSVPWDAVSEETRKEYEDSIVLFFGKSTQAVSYKIPKGTGHAIFWAHYVWCPREELENVMTSASGHVFSSYLPPGQMRNEVVEAHITFARQHLPAMLAELIEKTDEISAQAVSDGVPPENIFEDGKVLLIGEAAGCPRPHAFAGTAQAAYHALRLEDLLQGRITNDEWSRDTRQYSTDIVQASVDLGAICMEPGDVSKKPQVYAARVTQLAAVIARMRNARQNQSVH